MSGASSRPVGRYAGCLAGLLLAGLLLGGCEWVRLPDDGTVYDLDDDGWSADDDCDDYNDRVHPLAAESCNGVDNNCSGSEADADDADIWYVDLDGDGFGDAGGWVAACDPPPGYVAGAFDCDDADANVFVGAPETDCADPVDYNCDGFTAARDLDGDGWVGCEDCDDTRASTFPGAPEACNGVDDDCDGVVDGGVTPTRTWWQDADGDGWGGAAVAMEACGRPTGFSATDTDCDDDDPARHPDAPEACDGRDDDCDGLVDEPDRFGNDRWYADADGDGYGDPDAWEAACAPVPGRIAAAGDCDDADETVHPGAAESCDLVDEDCDGGVDDSPEDPRLWYRDADRDGWGTGADVARGCFAPSGFVADAGDCDDADATIHPGGVEVCGGVDEDCDGAFDEDGGPGCGVTGEMTRADADAVVVGSDTEDDFGAAVVGLGDLDGDGRGDLLVGAQGVDDGAIGAGAAYLFHGPLPTAGTADDADDAWIGERYDDRAGRALAAGDLDGDGALDLVVGAPFEDAAGDLAGAVYLLRGPATGGSLAGADGKRVGTDAHDYAGAALGVVDDFDADGDQELAVGAAGETAESGGAGAVYVFDDAPTGTGALADAGATLLGAAADDLFGHALVGAGDLDGDGLGDLAVGAYRNDDGGAGAGAAYVYLGPVYGVVTPAMADAVRSGAAAGDSAGFALAAGDVDADGYDDLVVGAFDADGDDAGCGAAYLERGPMAATGALGADATLLGVGTNDRAGTALAVGDLDDDGFADVAVGAQGASYGYAGAVRVAYGPLAGVSSLADAEAVFHGEERWDAVGTALFVLGDLDGDGFLDLGISASPEDATGATFGELYVLAGGPRR